MGKGQPNTRNWTARETTDFAGGNRKLTVTGEVEVGNLNETPSLAEAVPQGVNPTILLLELAITSAGVGPTVMNWKQASFERPVGEGEFASVEIISDGKQIATIDVERIHSVAQGTPS